MNKLILLIVAWAWFYTATGAIIIKPVIADIKCYGDSTGSISMMVGNGKAPYTYRWSNHLPPVATQKGLAAGKYSVTVTDKTGSSATASIALNQSPQMLLHISLGSNYINLTVKGGTPAYQYLWSNGVTTENLTNALPGMYLVTVKDHWGCTGTILGKIAVPISNDSGPDKLSSVVNSLKDLSANNENKDKEETRESTSNEAGGTKNSDLIVYPNPAGKQVSVKTSSTGPAQIELINTSGQRVLLRQTEGIETNLDISNLPNGNYFLRLSSESGVLSKTITVIK